MRIALLLSILAAVSFAQQTPKPPSSAKSATVPITLDHNRIVIDVYLPLPDGSTKRVRGWVDNGNPDLTISQRAARLMGLPLTCDDKGGKVCSAAPPKEVTIGDMKIPLSGVHDAKIRPKPDNADSVMVPGMSAEINIPSSVLRNYDVLISFPDREFTIAEPGTIHFKGMGGKVQINSDNGLVQIPSKLEGKNYNLALDTGASISFVSEELFDKISAAHPQWPRITGAIGPANMWGWEEEPKWKLMRLDRLQYGPLYLTNVAIVAFPKDDLAWFEKRAGIATAGLLGSNALLNYRIGIDYKHAMAYFEVGSTFKAPDFDAIGLTLRPEDDGRFTILGVAGFEGKPSVPEVQPGDRLVAVDGIPVPESTMGQVWSLLEGQPGQERKLTVEREGKQFIVVARVQHFLGDVPEEEKNKGSGKKH